VKRRRKKGIFDSEGILLGYFVVANMEAEN